MNALLRDTYVVAANGNGKKHIKEITKRNGKIVDFNREKIEKAIALCLTNDCGYSEADAIDVGKFIGLQVENLALAIEQKGEKVGVEDVQNLVEHQLMANGFFDAAKQYILFRKKREEERTQQIDPSVEEAFKQNDRYFQQEIQKFQALDKFARFDHEKGRRETWPETVERVMRYTKNHCIQGGFKVTDEEWTELHQGLLNLEASPSMRLVQMAGPALERCQVGVFNCLGVETAFVTDKGVRSFADFSPGDRVRVLGHSGEWRDAVVQCYGKQKLQKYTFVRGRTQLQVRATANHRWLLDSPMHATYSAKAATKAAITASAGRDSVETPSLLDPESTNSQFWETTELQPGDRLAKAPMPFLDWQYDDAEPFERLYWAYGFVFGNGTRIKKADGTYTHSMVRLCDHARKYLGRFEELGFKSSTPLSCKGDPIAYTGTYLKTLPSLERDGIKLVRAFVRGYLDADGEKRDASSGRNQFPTIQATGEEAIAFVREVFPAVGVYILREEDLTGQETNYGTRAQQTIKFSLLSAVGDGHNGFYSCRDVEEDGVEDVWCLEVEEDASFTLANGLLTGNCAFQALQFTKDMADELYILMQGTGAGFSVEEEFSVGHFPRVKKQKKDAAPHQYVIEDSTEGWCDAYKFGLDAWWAGEDVEFDFSKVRPAGAPLKTKGGKSSGPEPLRDLLNFARNRILERQGKYLTSLDLHDINCYAHRIVRMGGVRRASGISLSDLHDTEMRDCKAGQFWLKNEQRNQANNSAVYEDKPTQVVWMEEWLSMIKSQSGERGIFNRGALKKQFPKRRKYSGHLWGVNPCGEINLRNKQFCNLSISVVRPNLPLGEIKRRVRLATLWGTIQSTMTNFKYISPEWKKNCDEERLLGVDLLGFLDHEILQNNELAAPVLRELRQLVIDVNLEIANRFGIPQSTATTCVKPSGDSSLFFMTAAGFKGHHGEYYIRRVRGHANNPVMMMLKEAGVPCHQDYDGSGLVLEFPVKAPDNCVLLETQTAIAQLEKWKTYKINWTEHNPSVTIYVRPEEWLDVGKWVWDNWDYVGGLSFLPYDGGVYPLAPYEAIDKKEYDERMAVFPAINWAKLVKYETHDQTDLHQQVACTGGQCTI